MTQPTIDWAVLDAKAREVQQHAYCPYSNFHVGAALLAEDGTIIVGCNVESASFPATVCAETSAMAAAVAQGHRKIIAVSIVGESETGPTAPCGVCRQVLFEFNPEMQVHLFDAKGNEEFLTLNKHLLPLGFGGADMP